MIWLVAGLVALLGIHSTSILAPHFRARVAARMGELRWKAVYSIASVVALVALAHGCTLARGQPMPVYQPAHWMRHLAFVVMLPVFPLLLAAYLPGRIKSAVRHPMLVATLLWAVAHLLANGRLADLLLFGGFLVWAVADLVSVSRRQAATAPAAKPRPANDVIAVIAGLAIYALMVHWGHARLFGIAPGD
jgi:uncharacterized membrane protein